MISRADRLTLVGQGLFVVFLWSISKVLIKMGLLSVPPFTFIALVQLVSVIALGIFSYFRHGNYHFRLNRNDTYLAILIGLTSFVGANLFMVIGLQYVTGATAGLIASANVIFSILMSSLILRERPVFWQYVGILVIIAGSYIFLSNQVIAGSLIGIGLLIVAEIAFAYSNTLTRLVGERYERDISAPLALIGAAVGSLVLLPIALISDGLPTAYVDFRALVWIGVVGLIFAFAGMLWSAVLDKLRVIEATVIGNTMLIQVAVFSMMFLGEQLFFNNYTGGGLVIVGALLTNGQLLLPQLFGRTRSI